MAAVLCLVFLPFTMAGVGLLSTSTPSSGVAVLLLGGFMVFVAARMSRAWDGQDHA